jgi:FMN phosphatase YigB (HAD superfamily)
MITHPYNEFIFFVDLDNTICKSPYPLIFDEIVDEISKKTGKNPEFVFSLINSEFKIREELNETCAFDWDDILSCICRKMGWNWDSSLLNYINKFIDTYGITVFKGVEKTLKQLKKEKVKLYCTSNGYFEYQEPILRATGLLNLFDELITSDKVGITKSSKQFYESKYIDKNKVMIIGDSYKYEVYYPKKFGFHSIWDMETILSPTKVRKYLNSKPTERYPLINFELEKYFSNTENNIYSQNYKFTILPDAIIFNFQETLNAYKILVEYDLINNR